MSVSRLTFSRNTARRPKSRAHLSARPYGGADCVAKGAGMSGRNPHIMSHERTFVPCSDGTPPLWQGSICQAAWMRSKPWHEISAPVIVLGTARFLLASAGLAPTVPSTVGKVVTDLARTRSGFPNHASVDGILVCIKESSAACIARAMCCQYREQTSEQVASLLRACPLRYGGTVQAATMHCHTLSTNDRLGSCSRQRPPVNSSWRQSP